MVLVSACDANEKLYFYFLEYLDKCQDKACFAVDSDLSKNITQMSTHGVIGYVQFSADPFVIVILTYQFCHFYLPWRQMPGPFQIIPLFCFENHRIFTSKNNKMNTVRSPVYSSVAIRFNNRHLGLKLPQ